MRVIGGYARSLRLKTIESEGTRPTTDKIKETLFNMLQNKIEHTRFLDLFAGSGAIGIEALSRGATYACFVDMNRNAMECIKYNLEHTHLGEKAETITSDAVSALRRIESSSKEKFDIVFIDPPYNKNMEDRALDYLKDSMLIDKDTLIIVEMSRESDSSHFDDMGYTIIKDKQYRSNKHIFLKRRL